MCVVATVHSHPIVDDFSIYGALERAKVPAGEIAGPPGAAIDATMKVCRTANGGWVPVVLLDVPKIEGELRFDWDAGTALDVITLLCRKAEWTLTFTRHAVVIGTPERVSRFKEAWRKLPEPLPVRPWVLHSVDFRDAPLGDVCEFLNKKLKDVKIPGAGELKPLLKTDVGVWVDGQELPFGVLLRLIAASFGKRPSEVFGVTEYE